MAAGVTRSRGRITMRGFVSPLPVLLLCAVGACSRPEPAASAITACYSGTEATSSAVPYAAEQGYFDRNGLQVELLFANGGSAAVATLLSGQSQICQMSGPSVVSAAQAGEDLVVVAGIVNTAPFTLVTHPSITAPNQLVGKTVASPAGGGSYELGLRLYLSQLGVPFDQVGFAPLGSQAAVVAAMESGAVAAALQVPPESTGLLASGFTELALPSDRRPAFQHIALVTRREYLASHRPTVRAYVRAVAEAIAAMKQDESGAIAVMAKYRKLDPVAQREGLLDAYRTIVQRVFSTVPAPSLDGVAFIISQSPARPGARAVSAADLVDTSIVDELRREGLFRDAPP